ncbi:MAG TPA: hypothetical protein IAB48_01915 [Candidatus Fimimorpha excrementavium]|nr:hypothetical protein [Candidatus Fimimorpha excrementavium]
MKKMIGIVLFWIFLAEGLLGCGNPGSVGKGDGSKPVGESGIHGSDTPGETETAGEEEGQDSGCADPFPTEAETVGEEEEEQILEEVQAAALTYQDLYAAAEKGEALNAVIDAESLHAIADRMAQAGYTVTCDDNDRNMANWESLDAALSKANEGETVSAVFYSLASYGGFHCYQMAFSHGEMLLTTAEMDWSEEGDPYLSYLERIRVYSWEYTEKGWLIWEKEPSKNMEMDRHTLTRVKPLEETARMLCETYIEPVGYAMTNLFLTDWSADAPGDLALNDTFGILYFYQYGQNPPYEDQVPAQEWEAVMTRFLPFSVETLRQNSVYEPQRDSYAWKSWGYGSGMALPSLPFPEVVSWEKADDQIWVLEVEGVSKEEGMDCAFAHEVTLQIHEDGSAVYLSNRLIPEKKNSVPRYRIRSGT